MMREMLAMGRNRSCSLNSSVSTIASSAIFTYEMMIHVFSGAAPDSPLVNGNCPGSAQKFNGEVNTTSIGAVASTMR